MWSETGPEGFLVPVGAPAGFVPHAYQRSLVVSIPMERVWAWLNDPATFTEGQVWPFRVEFGYGGFEPGVLNVHHGPLWIVVGGWQARSHYPRRCFGPPGSYTRIRPIHGRR